MNLAELAWTGWCHQRPCGCRSGLVALWWVDDDSWCWSCLWCQASGACEGLEHLSFENPYS